MLQFIQIFSWLLLAGSLFIVSFYNLSRHYIEVQPDGTEKVEGYILKWWSYFWENVPRGTSKVYYKGEALKEKLLLVQNTIGDILPINDGDCSFNLMYNSTFHTNEEYRNHIKSLEKITNSKIDSNGTAYFMYIEEPIYRFHEWIRKPISQCYICMSSVFGSVIYFTFCSLYPKLYIWSEYPKFALILFWIVFIVLLTSVNKFLYKKIIM